jgi:hypothetical protein
MMPAQLNPPERWIIRGTTPRLLTRAKQPVSHPPSQSSRGPAYAPMEQHGLAGLGSIGDRPSERLNRAPNEPPWTSMVRSW